MVLAMVIVTTIANVESMVTMVMLLKHWVRALHIGLETVGNLWKTIDNAIRKLLCACCLTSNYERGEKGMKHLVFYSRLMSTKTVCSSPV